MKLILPLKVKVNNKYWFVNLNNYRNTHYRLLNNAKKAYHKEVYKLLGTKRKRFKKPVTITYTVYFKDKRTRDIMNTISVVDKFVCDALVMSGTITDDSYKFVTKVIGKFGKLDSENPRVEVVIK